MRPCVRATPAAFIFGELMDFEKLRKAEIWVIFMLILGIIIFFVASLVYFEGIKFLLPNKYVPHTLDLPCSLVFFMLAVIFVSLALSNI